MKKRCIPTILLLLTLTLAFPAGAQLVPGARTTGVMSPQKAATLEFRVAANAPKTGELAYVVTDYAGAKISEGKAALAGQADSETGQTVTLTLTLPAGYYDVTFPALKQTVGVICMNPLRGRKDPFFCLDAGLSWLAPEQPDRQRLMTLMTQLSIDIARERLYWGSVNSGIGKFDWEGDRHYDGLRKRYELTGLGVLEVFHDTPKYLGPTERNPYPDDLVSASQAMTAVANRWRDAHAGIEIWNEPDIHFGNHLPADQYVPLVKAVSRGLATAKISTPLGGGVLSSLDDDAFLRGLAEGGLTRAVDFVSFHNYGDDAASIRKQVVKCRQWLATAGAEGAGIWITECGKSWPTKSGARAERPDDAASALAIVVKAVEARACGVERYFPFVLPFYVEGERNFSMTGKDGTPLRSLAAYGACIALLSNRTYVGDLIMPLDKRLPIVQSAPIFADDATAVVVFYGDKIKPGLDKPGSQGFDWTLPLPITRILGIDGRELQAGKNGDIPIIPLDDGVAYVLVSVKDLGPLVTADTERMRLTRLSRQVHAREPLPPILLQHRPDFASIQASSSGYKITKGDVKKWPLALRVNNFSLEEELTLTVRAFPAPPPTATTQPVRATTRPTAPKPLASRTVTLTAGKNSDLTLTLDLTASGSDILITVSDDNTELDRLLIQFAR